jgi:biopolymer transport protein ExbD
MAEIDSSGGGKKGGSKGVRSKKSSTKVDMTPMVDLAFLLITFFMLTTTLSKPQAKQVFMPDNTTKKTTELDDDNALTIVIGENDKLYYYTGAKKPQVSSTDYSPEGIRHVLNKKNKERGEKLVVIIKAMDKSKYRNIVDILDEMFLTNTKHYAILDITPQDIELVNMEDAHKASDVN